MQRHHREGRCPSFPLLLRCGDTLGATERGKHCLKLTWATPKCGIRVCSTVSSTTEPLGLENPSETIKPNHSPALPSPPLSPVPNATSTHLLHPSRKGDFTSTGRFWWVSPPQRGLHLRGQCGISRAQLHPSVSKSGLKFTFGIWLMGGFFISFHPQASQQSVHSHFHPALAPVLSTLQSFVSTKRSSADTSQRSSGTTWAAVRTAECALLYVWAALKANLSTWICLSCPASQRTPHGCF